MQASFTYDGDGRRVKSVTTTNIATTTTYFVGAHYEVTGSVVTKYYYAGSQRIAMRQNGDLKFILGDHLGSTSLVTDAVGNVISQQYYKAWGETRYASGTEQTKYQYTGQYSDSYINLLWHLRNPATVILWVICYCSPALFAPMFRNLLRAKFGMHIETSLLILVF